ncbi:zinc-binding dehydrogenase [Brevibacterium sp. 'Marine']|uniref:zinc-binding dehydrogenase n=1 Tax=Brevibacterium sp. 'Marine' TaxID=2725563 RepID=UPI002006DC84|nr:zinc-binding dehydrogenase [Brevibacterium sp. 'Marine']
MATGYGAVVHGAEVSPSDTVAVIGCGGVGIAAIQAARIAGASRVIAIDLHDEKLDRAHSFGATDVVRADDRLVAAVHEIVPGGVDKSFEAVGSPATASAAFNILAADGTATILGLQPAGNTITIDAEMLIEGDRQITGAYMGANRLAQDVRSFSDHRRRGTLDLASMVTSTWSFDEINAGLKTMTDPDSVRAVVTF